MILTSEVEIKLGPSNYRYYNNLGYTQNKIITVKIEHLLPTCRVMVLVECDFCKREVSTTYKNYNYNYNSFDMFKFSCCAKCTFEKTKINNLNKYGVEYINQRNDIKEKTFNNSIKNQKKYDIDILTEDTNHVKFKYIITKEVLVTINKWNIEHYIKLGYKNIKQNTKWVVPVEHLMTNAIARVDCLCDCGKITNISFQKFNINYNRSETYNCKSCNNITLKKYYNDNFGVENSMQLTSVFDKSQKNGFKIKEYKGIKYQGTYELDFLEFCDSNNIIEKVSKVDSIKYKYNDKIKYYHPDFFIEELNLIVEIKSDYYYYLYLEKNLCKEKYCIEQGYNFIFIINKDYSEFFNKIKKSS